MKQHERGEGGYLGKHFSPPPFFYLKKIMGFQLRLSCTCKEMHTLLVVVLLVYKLEYCAPLGATFLTGMLQVQCKV